MRSGEGLPCVHIAPFELKTRARLDGGDEFECIEGVSVSLATKTFTENELAEVFPRSPLREVVFEVRFKPNLRVLAEIWRLQETLESVYPTVRKESPWQPSGEALDVTVFQNPADSRVVSVWQLNFAIAFTQYGCFEDFKVEVLRQTTNFCQM